MLDNHIHTAGEDKAARHMEGIADIAAVLAEADFCFVPVVVVLLLQYRQIRSAAEAKS